ncbi:NAD+ synthase [candidate division TA06 bacterium]|uniref:Glutamine-dependent NAD(+) synthetase n=1 Tax=candidate division TA06 bacterium TaxID=2250710 RepID=A0A933IAQ4_UNCT6|nr:NAD+ synthase [candidate division TA06 bacterium]
MKIALCQYNPVVGDIDGNLAKVATTLMSSTGEKPDLLVFPELFLTGYPPRDLLEKDWFLRKTEQAIKDIAKMSSKRPDIGILIGAPILAEEVNSGKLYNSALLIHRGKVIFTQHKTLLPSYDVFDETRYFRPAEKVSAIKFKGQKLGISICEDAWNDAALWPKGIPYQTDPIKVLAKAGAEVFINLSASPFEMGKADLRSGLFTRLAKKYRKPFIYVNQVGGNDELVFDGRSFVVNEAGQLVLMMKAFEEGLKVVDTDFFGSSIKWPKPDPAGDVYQALVLGLRDYLEKTGFHKAVIGLSGGIDSALVACIAAEALGPQNVLGISMPSPYSSPGSVDDSRKLAENLGIEFKVIPISGLYRKYLTSLKNTFKGAKSGLAEENIQARIRGNLLMACSNKFGHIVLSTGNKSEMAVGYCTLYGDMSGGLSVISDVPKTLVYKLADHVNRHREVIPRAIIKKAPSAELKPNQKDQDTLPPYPLLDAILEFYLEEGRSREEIIKRGFKPTVVDWVIKAVRNSEYKRRQAAPGLKVTSKAFGSGRRMPVAAKY